MLNSIKTLKRYCQVTLNVFFNQKLFDDDIKSYLYDRCLCKIEILLLNMLKMLKFEIFKVFYAKVVKFQVFPGFQVKWQP